MLFFTRNSKTGRTWLRQKKFTLNSNWYQTRGLRMDETGGPESRTLNLFNLIKHGIKKKYIGIITFTNWKNGHHLLFFLLTSLLHMRYVPPEGKYWKQKDPCRSFQVIPAVFVYLFTILKIWLDLFTIDRQINFITKICFKLLSDGDMTFFKYWLLKFYWISLIIWCH